MLMPWTKITVTMLARPDEFFVGARQLVRQDGGSGGQFYGAQPLQPTQTRAPTGERLQFFAEHITTERRS